MHMYTYINHTYIQTCTYIHFTNDVLTWLSHVADEVSQVTYKREMTHCVQSPDRKEGAEQFVEFPGSVCMYVCMYVCMFISVYVYVWKNVDTVLCNQDYENLFLYRC